MAIEDVVRQYILPIAGAFFLAWVIHRLSRRIVGRFFRLSGLAPRNLRLREERQRTMHDLLASMVSFAAFLAALLFTLSRFVAPDTLVWMVGLFSAAFGLGARPLIADWLTGVGYLFEDTYDVGDKVEILGIEGVIEALNLRTTFLRAPTGELYVIPNGEVRVIRNFSRGRFSTAKIKLHVATADLGRVLPILEDLGAQAVVQIPDLLEPWQVLTSGDFGQQVELTLVIKTRFGRAAESRPQVMTLVQRALEEAEIAVPA